jgi:hypothetical protein
MNIPHADGPGVLSTLETTGSRSQRTQAKGCQVPVAYERAAIHPLAAGGTLVESGAEVSASSLESGQSHLP